MRYSIEPKDRKYVEGMAFCHLQEHLVNHYKLIGIDLSKQFELEHPDLKQINSIGKLEEDNGLTMFFIIEKSEETTLSFSQNSVSII